MTRRKRRSAAPPAEDLTEASGRFQLHVRTIPLFRISDDRRARLLRAFDAWKSPFAQDGAAWTAQDMAKSLGLWWWIAGLEAEGPTDATREEWEGQFCDREETGLSFQQLMLASADTLRGLLVGWLDQWDELMTPNEEQDVVHDLASPARQMAVAHCDRDPDEPDIHFLYEKLACLPRPVLRLMAEFALEDGTAGLAEAEADDPMPPRTSGKAGQAPAVPPP